MDKETVKPRRHSPETKRLAAQYLAMSVTPQWPTGNATFAAAELAKRGIAVPARTIDDWRSHPKFRELFAKVKDEHYRALQAEVIADTGLEPAEQMAKLKAIYLKRLLAEAAEIPIEKVPEAYEKIDRVQRLEQGKPTEIQEQQLAELRELEDKGLDDLRDMLAQRLADIPSASQAVDNPHALEKKPN